MKHFKAALAALTMLCGIAAMPAHAQSLEDQAAAAAPAPTQVVKDQPVAASSTTEVSYVQAPVQTETSITPRVSFQTTGSRDDWRLYVDANVRAYHFDRAEAHANHYLEANYGGGFEITNDVLGATFGYYHNSIHRRCSVGLPEDVRGVRRLRFRPHAGSTDHHRSGLRDAIEAPRIHAGRWFPRVV
ncbi:hypothetical protein [Burkholderia anthina]|uniref:hypothetical protein n=1 Tax=Burkholderia anthina TaxID=179879 RepID=UPI0037C182B8